MTKFLKMSDVFLLALDELRKPHPADTLPDWNVWNAVTGGFRPREYTILCGATGRGKTTFLANISAQLLKAKVKHFVMSVETGHTDYVKRWMSVAEGRDINTGDPVPLEELVLISQRHLQMVSEDNMELSIYENRVPVHELMNDLRTMADRGCKVALIDNLNFFMEPTSAVNANLEMDRVTHELVILCKSIDMHIVMVMHPKKTDDAQVRSEFDIKGSSTAVQEAHNILLFNEPSEEQLGHKLPNGVVLNRGHRLLLINKMRRRGGFRQKTIVFESNGTRYKEVGLL